MDWNDFFSLQKHESVKTARRWFEMKSFSTVWSRGVLACVQARKESLISILLHSQLFTATTVLDESTNLDNCGHHIGHVAQLER